MQHTQCCRSQRTKGTLVIGSAKEALSDRNNKGSSSLSDRGLEGMRSLLTNLSILYSYTHYSVTALDCYKGPLTDISDRYL